MARGIPRCPAAAERGAQNSSLALRQSSGTLRTMAESAQAGRGDHDRLISARPAQSRRLSHPQRYQPVLHRGGSVTAHRRHGFRQPAHWRDCRAQTYQPSPCPRMRRPLRPGNDRYRGDVSSRKDGRIIRITFAEVRWSRQQRNFRRRIARLSTMILRQFPDRTCHARRGGFTLIELLAVVAILGVLASLAMVALSGVRKSAARAEGVAKLRDIGLAMNSYALDNGGNLPGPLKQGQSPWRASSGHLINYIQAYIAPAEAAGSGFKGMQESFVTEPWVRWFRSSGLPSAVAYYANVAIQDPDSPGTYYFPVGNVGAKSKNNRPVGNPNLWKARLPASITPILWDWTDTPNASPPFGEIYNGINVLFLDWHVENQTDVGGDPGTVRKPKGW
ncbi:MAG: type II secretion system protein [Chthoniobacterales bacterium]|nr:type II secretion system protein [Chthoniobacterales bacterium]